MEGATITQDSDNEPLYQQGRFPSIIDTDDMVFELGKQVVNHLNHEKLLDVVIKKNNVLETALRKAVDAENKMAELKLSNEQYVENNQRLDAELVKARNELEGHEAALQKFETSLNIANETITSLEDELQAKNEIISQLERKKSPKKKKKK